MREAPEARDDVAMQDRKALRVGIERGIQLDRAFLDEGGFAG